MQNYTETMTNILQIFILRNYGTIAQLCWKTELNKFEHRCKCQSLERIEA